MSTTTISFRCPEGMRRQIEKTGIPVSVFIRDAVQSKLDGPFEDLVNRLKRDAIQGAEAARASELEKAEQAATEAAAAVYAEAKRVAWDELNDTLGKLWRKTEVGIDAIDFDLAVNSVERGEIAYE